MDNQLLMLNNTPPSEVLPVKPAAVTKQPPDQAFADSLKTVEQESTASAQMTEPLDFVDDQSAMSTLAGDYRQTLAETENLEAVVMNTAEKLPTDHESITTLTTDQVLSPTLTSPVLEDVIAQTDRDSVAVPVVQTGTLLTEVSQASTAAAVLPVATSTTSAPKVVEQGNSTPNTSLLLSANKVQPNGFTALDKDAVLTDAPVPTKIMALSNEGSSTSPLTRARVYAPQTLEHITSVSDALAESLTAGDERKTAATINSLHHAELLNTMAARELSASLIQTPVAKTQLSVTLPFAEAQWGQALNERVVWMSAQGIQEAEIHLDPPELGPLQVKVTVEKEQAHVSFTVQHASVRDALDQNALRLREMFDSDGINLVNVDISDQAEQQADANNDENPGATSDEGGDTQEISDHHKRTSYGLVDAYV
ncbi:MAG: flagellar hook-length control protein FliK [Cellvibrionaceae bacterium]|nr:flagellar hook-length control protein FliK [Cellvibrionaceae bacterium]